MKRILALLSAAILCLALSACGVEESGAVSAARQESSSAGESVPIGDAESETPSLPGKPGEKVSVTITPENVLDYFEECPRETWESDRSGAYDSFQSQILLVLKEEYRTALVEEETKIVLQVRIDKDRYTVTADPERKTWKRTELEKSDSGDFTAAHDCRNIGRDAYGIELFAEAFLRDGKTEGDALCMTSFKILRAKGTLVYVQNG